MARLTPPRAPGGRSAPSERGRLPRKVGVELEFDRCSVAQATEAVHAVVGGEVVPGGVLDGRKKFWRIGPDGPNIELASPPLETASELTLLKDVATALHARGARTHAGTGLHVHVDAASLSMPAFVQLLTLMRQVEPALLESFHVRPERLARFCRPVPAELLETLPSAAHLGKVKLACAMDRYHTLNLRNLRPLAPQHTVEFRYPNGTLMGPLIGKHVGEVLGLVEEARSRAARADPVPREARGALRRRMPSLARLARDRPRIDRWMILENLDAGERSRAERDLARLAAVGAELPVGVLLAMSPAHRLSVLEALGDLPEGERAGASAALSQLAQGLEPRDRGSPLVARLFTLSAAARTELLAGIEAAAAASPPGTGPQARRAELGDRLCARELALGPAERLDVRSMRDPRAQRALLEALAGVPAGRTEAVAEAARSLDLAGLPEILRGGLVRDLGNFSTPALAELAAALPSLAADARERWGLLKILTRTPSENLGPILEAARALGLAELEPHARAELLAGLLEISLSRLPAATEAALAGGLRGMARVADQRALLAAVGAPPSTDATPT